MKYEVKENQLFWLLITVMPASKCLSLPSLLVKYAWQDSWLAILGLFLIDYLFFVAMAVAVLRNRGRLPLQRVLEKSLTKIGAKIAFLFLASFFGLRLIGLILDFMELFHTTLTISTNWLAFALPVLAFSLFTANKGARTIARLCEILAIPVLCAGWIMVLLSLDETDFSHLLPMLQYPAGVLRAMYHHTSWFGDSVFLLFFLDRIKPGKRFLAKVSLGYWVSVVCVLAVCVTYFGLYGNTAWMHRSIIAKVSQFNVTVTTNGRWDWLCLLVWMASLLIKSALFSFCMVQSLQALLGTGRIKTPVSYAVVLAFVLTLPLCTGVESFLNKTASTSKLFYVVQYLLPLASPFLVQWQNNACSKALWLRKRRLGGAYEKLVS